MLQFRKTSSAVLSLALAGVLSVGCAGVAMAADATETPSALGTIASLFGSDEADAVEETAAANPFGIYDPATGQYVNAFFGFSYQLGGDWEVQGHDAASAEEALQAVSSQNSAIDLLAINRETAEILLTQVMYNGDHEVIDLAAVEQNADLFVDALIAGMGTGGEVTGSSVVTAKFAGQDIPVIMFNGAVDANGVQMDFYGQTAFISSGDYVIVVAGVSFGEDTTYALLNSYQPYSAGGSSAQPAAAAQIAGVVDKASGVFTSGHFGYSIYLGGWAATAADKADDAAALDAALQGNGAVVDLLAQNAEIGSEVISLIVANESGAVDQEFVETYGLGSIGAFLTAAGLTPDPEFSNFPPALLEAVQGHNADLAKSPLSLATSISVEAASLDAAQVAGHDVLVLSLGCTAIIDDSEIPVFLDMVIMPDDTGAYVNMIGVISYIQDQTAELLGLFEAK